jgi:hypothetical protein
MMMAVYGGVALIGQAVKSPSNKPAMIIRVFMVVLVVRRFHCTMSVKGRSDVKPTRFLALPLDVVVCL